MPPELVLCAHAEQDGEGMHTKASGDRCVVTDADLHERHNNWPRPWCALCDERRAS